MEKLIIIGCALLLTGCCGTPTVKIKTEVQESLVPILYSPAPPVIERPELPIHKMTPEQIAVDGEIVKFYKATIKTLIGYSEELKAGLDEYGNINKAYEAEQKKVEAEIAEREAAKKNKEK